MAISSFLDFSRKIWQKLDLSDSQAETMAARTKDIWSRLSADSQSLLDSLVADYTALTADSVSADQTGDEALIADAGDSVRESDETPSADTAEAETLSDGIEATVADTSASNETNAAVAENIPLQTSAATASDTTQSVQQTSVQASEAEKISDGIEAAEAADAAADLVQANGNGAANEASTDNGTAQTEAADTAKTDAAAAALTAESSNETPLDLAEYEGWTYFGGDEFNGNALDTEKWFAYGDSYGISGTGYNRNYGSNMKMLQTYTPDMVDVSDGHLIITSKRDTEAEQKYGHDAWLSGAVSSRETENYFPLYSRVDVSAKIANDIGIWHAPWLRHYNGASTAEIDIGEFFANYKTPKTGLNEYNTVTQSLHLHDENSQTLSKSVGRNGMRTTLDDEIDENFHLYSVIVERGEAENQAKISYLVDNEVQYSVLTDQDSARDYNKFITDAVEDSRTENTWDFIFQGGIGGNNASMGNPQDGLDEVKSEIDYVRVYVKDEDYADLAAAREAADGQVISEADSSRPLHEKTQTITDAEGKEVSSTIYEETDRSLAYITGNGGNNILQGGDAAEHLSGYGGNDRLIGGKGSDELVGGAGSDVFVFDNAGGADKILDFYAGQDKIELSSDFFKGFSGKGTMSEQDFSDRIQISANAAKTYQTIYYKPVEGGTWTDLAKINADVNLTHSDFIVG